MELTKAEKALILALRAQQTPPSTVAGILGSQLREWGRQAAEQEQPTSITYYQQSKFWTIKAFELQDYETLEREPV
jgi:hypothetical protein